MRAIFVSYRRDDSEGEAGRLFDDLVGHFGEDSVFMDVAAIEAGRDFRKAIDESVATCGVLLAMIGKNWTDAKNEAGQRRLDDPFDFVRLETASALKRDIPVVPVLVHGAKMPRADQLPDDLKELAYRNGVELTHARWNSDLQLLIKALRPHVEDRKNVAASPSQAAAAERKPPVRVEAKVPEVAAEPSPAPAKKPTGMILAVVAAVLVVGAVVAYMTLGPKQVTVPDLSGNTLSDATAKLEALHLAVGQKTGKDDPTKAPNTILSQSPSPNARVKTGSTVDLTYSQPPTMIEVPKLVGKSLDAARQALEDLHLTVGNISKETKSDVTQNNIVLDEFPKPPKKVDGGTAIDLVVSEAPVTPVQGASPMVAVPNLVGQSLAQARAQIQTSGLALGSATPQSKPGTTSGTVLNQSPNAGQQVSKGTTVNLWVAQAPQVLPISITASNSPPMVSPGGTTAITVVAGRPDGSGIPGATVRIGAGGGTFGGSGSTNVVGSTDNQGVYRISWTAPAPNAASAYVMGVSVTKEGFQVGKEQLTVSGKGNSAQAPGPFTGTYTEIDPATGGNYRITQFPNEIHTSLSGIFKVPLINDHTARVAQTFSCAIPDRRSGFDYSIPGQVVFTFTLQGSILVLEASRQSPWPCGGNSSGASHDVTKFRKISDTVLGSPGARP
jgi:beta-lactam-binding protein with PASTA domain